MKIPNLHKIIFPLLFIVLVNPIFTQPRKGVRENIGREAIYFEVHVFPEDSLFNCFVSYKIPYGNLLFVRNGNKFISGIEISFELKAERQIVKRFFISEKVSEKIYKNTLAKDKYLEGVTSFLINKGEYFLTPVVSLNNTDLELRVKPINIVVGNKPLFKPIIISSEVCDSSSLKLSNFENSIPFSKKSFNMLIPVTQKDITSIKIIVEQDGKFLYDQFLNKSITLSDSIVRCANGIGIRRGNKNTYFILNNVNKKLLEGRAVLTVLDEHEVKYDLSIVWFNKPRSLMNIEEAIESMRLINLNNVADSLEDINKEKLYTALFSYWSKFDDEPSTSFNEVFNEFYSRIDYIKDNFNSLNKQDALETDRGKTYLIYGKPSSIDREYSDVYNILEVWTYDSIGEKIYFADKTGRGNFKRIK